jgi:hypothetical protein
MGTRYVKFPAKPSDHTLNFGFLVAESGPPDPRSLAVHELEP